MLNRHAKNSIHCPDPETLKRLLNDVLDPTEVASVEEHVDDCPCCQHELNRLVGSLPDALASPWQAEDEGPPDLPGYALLGRIDAGGMGVIWRARDLQFGRDLAVKVIASWGRSSPRLIGRFIAEAQICAQLTHPFIVPVHTMSRLPDGRPFYTMKLVEGRTLAALLEGGAAERRMEFVQIFDKVCQAAAFAHGRGVIHRDLKPENVMVGAHGEVQLMDWGLAKVLTDAAPRSEDGADATDLDPDEADGIRTRVGSVMGTAAYMAPEQAQGLVEEVDRQSDVFGLGGTLCKILTGEPPYTGPNAETVRRRAIEADLTETLARLHGCGADPELIGLAERCLTPQKADRPADAGMVAAQLAVYQARVQERLRQAEWERAAAQAAATVERTARRRTRALAAAVLALAVLAAGGGLWVQHQATERQVERARQEGILRQEIAADLDQAVRFRQSGQFPVSRHLLEQAQQRLAKGGPDDLRTRVGQCLTDTALARRLDEARQRASNWVDGKYDVAGAEQDYAAAFTEAGLGRQDEIAEEAGARVRTCAVQTEIVAALDAWAGLTRDTERRAWLLAVARSADPDPDRDRLRQPELWRDRKALTQLAKSPSVAQLSPQLLTVLAQALETKGGDAIPLLRTAQARQPDDFWFNAMLGAALHRAKQWDESIGFYRAALALRPQSSAIYNNLGNALRDRGRVEEAIRHFTESIRLDPKNAIAHCNLGDALSSRSQSEEAIDHYKEALRLRPKYVKAHINFGNLLKRRGQVKAAIGHYEEALRLDPKNSRTHVNLGMALEDDGNMETAITHYQQALRLDAGDVKAHYNLGNALREKGEEKAALAHYRETLRLDPAHAHAHCNLGKMLFLQGHFEEALTLVQRGHELGSKQPDWRYPSAQWVQYAQRMLLLYRKLPTILRGETKPADAVEQLDLAYICRIKKRYAAAVRFASDAFASQPRHADDLQADHRYNAACAAALAGCGQGQDAAGLSDTEKTQLRRQAHDWLDATLILRSKQLSGDRRADEKPLRHWLNDPDLVGVRDAAALANLPEAEQRQWRNLWQQHQRLLEKVSK